MSSINSKNQDTLHLLPEYGDDWRKKKMMLGIFYGAVNLLWWNTYCEVVVQIHKKVTKMTFKKLV